MKSLLFLVFIATITHVIHAQVVQSPPGCEDICYMESKNVWVVSSVDRRSKTQTQGSIFCLSENGEFKLLIKPNFPFNPHGISVLEKYGNTYIFVINHRQKKHTTIDRFRWESDTLVYEKSFEDKLIFSPNDLATTDTSSFVFTNDPLARNFLSLIWGFVTHIKQDKVVIWNENEAKILCKMSSPNGIQYDRELKKLYISSVYDRSIYVFDVKSGKKLEKIKTFGAPDNLEWDECGNLWFASHPSIGKFLKHVKRATKLSPSYVGKIKFNSEKPVIEEVFNDNGTQISAVSVASVGRNKIALGAVFDSKVLFIKK